MFTDYVQNGRGFGPVGSAVAQCGFDLGLRRPFRDEKGHILVTVNTGRVDGNGDPIRKTEYASKFVNNGLVVNAPFAFRKLEWVLLDQIVVRAARQRLRAWGDLAAANSFGGFNGMAKTELEYEAMSDPGYAQVDMSGLSEGRSDSPLFQLRGIPLPITHSDFFVDARKLAVSRNSGTPVDMMMGEASARRVAEMIERTLIGTVTGLTYGGTPIPYQIAPTVYGYLNFPYRIVYNTVNIPTGGGWSPAKTIANVLGMIQAAANNNFFGPFMLYHSTDWDYYMDNDYILTGGNTATQTLRNRLRSIDQIQDVKRLDFLPASTNPFTFIMVQMTSEVARAVNGMDITTIQWEAKGGMEIHFKVMAIQVPQLRADYSGSCGIVVGTTS